jgi:hypothetical protein
MRSASEQTTFPDRSIRYNYYDYATRRWVANDSDFIQSGWDVFTDRSGYGTLDVNPRDGIPYISAHHGTPIHPVVAREMGHGSGLFEYCEGPGGYLWSVTVVDTAGWVHAALIDDASRNRILHARMRTWCQWETPHGVAPPQPDPGFPCHHIVTSRVSHRVVLTWVFSEGEPAPGVYRETTDGGTTWLEPQELPWPPAFGGDTVPSYHITGLFPYYDRQDRFHIVTTVMPYVGGQGDITPVEIWHWCRENDPQWSRIVRVQCDPANIRCPVGYNTLLACRPSIGEDRAGGLHVCWEQFDTLNFEPGPPERLRADIWYARDNDDNGASWQDPVRLTVPDETSKRFPCIYDYAHEDTMRVLYLQDSVAGFFVQGEGNPSRNPVICQHVPITVGGVAERGTPDTQRFMSSATIVRGVLWVPEPNRHSGFEGKGYHSEIGGGDANRSCGAVCCRGRLGANRHG